MSPSTKTAAAAVHCVGTMWPVDLQGLSPPVLTIFLTNRYCYCPHSPYEEAKALKHSSGVLEKHSSLGHRGGVWTQEGDSSTQGKVH